jgi:transcriptional regulator with XRE-family HTH domain
MTTTTGQTWKALREASGLSQVEAERRMGWKRGHLSWIERGIAPTGEQESAMRRLYATLIFKDGQA